FDIKNKHLSNSYETSIKYAINKLDFDFSNSFLFFWEKPSQYQRFSFPTLKGHPDHDIKKNACRRFLFPT
ncbi:TPA: hypothetical protein ACGOV0_002049, partial [Streptococcus suis]